MRNLKNSIRNCIKSFAYAMTGISHLFKYENNMRYQLTGGLAVIGLGIYFKVSTTEWLILIAMIGLVLMAEAFNTAIEKLCDFVHPDQHAKIGVVKDLAAGAVLIISITTTVVGLIILGGKIW